ncbi:MAG: hypothetical protein QXZ41_03805 [Ignisphaera sp.]
MEYVVDLVIIGNVNASKCIKLTYILSELKADFYIFCGGLGECLDSLDFVEKGFGVPSIHDDDYVIKVLKERNLFISGRWAKINNVCVAGVDAKNPVLSINRISSGTIPQECSLYVIVLTYPLSISKCSKVNFGNKEYSIGLPKDLSVKITELINTVGLIIACQENSAELCLDHIGSSALYLSIPKTISIVRVKLDVQNRNIASINVLG